MAYNTCDACFFHGRISAHGRRVTPPRGGLVVSLDFELEWGVRDTLAVDGGYRETLLGAREAVPRMLDAFAASEVAATWATVGFLFAESRDELDAFAPALRPRYANPALDPYTAAPGRDEHDDPIHYAPSLLREIAARPRQEIGSHTFSHFYGLEAGATTEAFDADLASAVAIARARGITLRSLVFPRNQVRDDLLPIVARHDFRAYRGPERHLLSKPRAWRAQQATGLRGARLLDAHVNLTGSNTIPWDEVRPRDGLVDVPGSRFLRPWSPSLRLIDPLRTGRVVAGMRRAARLGGLYHLWWHPHNFGVNQDENLAALDGVLRAYRDLRDAHGFASYTMAEVAALADQVEAAAPLGERSGAP